MFVTSGFSKGLLADLDKLVPAGSVVVLEERDVIVVREVERRAAKHPCVAEVRAVPIQDEDAIESATAGVERPSTLRAVIPAVEYGVVAAAALAERWCLPGAGLHAARRLRDKRLLRRAAEAAGISQPAWREVRDAEDLAGFRTTRDACVLKPANRQASLGVLRLGAEDDTVAAWTVASAVEEPRARASSAPPTAYMVEELLVGPEVSVEALVVAGSVTFANVTAKAVAEGRHPVETGHLVPAPLPTEVGRRLRAAMTSLVRAVGFRDGVLHAEWILVDGSRPHLVECAGRLPGDGIDTLIDLAYGGSLLADYLAVLGGEPRPERGGPLRAAAVAYVCPVPGTVVRVGEPSAVLRRDGVVAAELTVAPGDKVQPLSSSWDRVGHVVVVAETPQGALADARARAAELAVETVPR
ncbi:ATP-grasp domain-containing protein [Antribacter gilvus]|uniref:ATP-grasp domain-containing protein n=1 Tax=Antribacter gilvus TaxID=2304675 RepID=UPI0013E0436A|nr:ATP-grasp domain-containing protein [Antribacter gilvus]